MSLLDELRVNIADEAPSASGAVLVPQSCSLLGGINLETIVQDLTIEGDLVVCGSQSWGRRIVTAAGGVTIGDSDNIVLLNKTVGEATTVTIPAPGATNKSRLIIIKDMKGDASINNISIVASVGTIDGQNTWILNQNYQSFTLIDNGTEWNII